MPEQIVIDLVEQLYQDVLEQNCVVFLGAGSTTERIRNGPRFYSIIKSMANLPKGDPDLSFPALMQHYCDTQDGGKKNRLIRTAISYIERFLLPGPDNTEASLVTDALSGVPFLKRYVTTNWDPFLERSLDVLIPAVEDRDLAFWDDNKRQVLKIHGSIDRPSSLVSTTEDYARCVDGNPVLFTKLRDLMATKTFIFLGYSLRDSDFQELWSSITSRLGPFSRLAYAINPHADSAYVSHWRSQGVSVIRSLDIHFVDALTAKLVSEDEIASPQLVGFLQKERSRLIKLHLKNSQRTTGGFASAMYQDGLLHELSDLLTSIGLGLKTSNDFVVDRRSAEREVQKAVACDNVIEIAYLTGRYTILDHYCRRDFSYIPPYVNPSTLTPTKRFIKGESMDDADFTLPPTD